MALSKSVFNPAKAIHSKVVIFSLLAAAFLVVLFLISTLVMDDENDFFDRKKHKPQLDISQEVKQLLDDAKHQEHSGEHKTIVIKGSNKNLGLSDPKTKAYVEAFKEAINEFKEESKNAQEASEDNQSNTQIVVIKENDETVEPIDTKKASQDTAQEKEQSKLTVISNNQEKQKIETKLQTPLEKTQENNKQENLTVTESKTTEANTLKQDPLLKDPTTDPNLESSKPSVEPTLESNSKSTSNEETTHKQVSKVTVVDLDELEKSDKSESVSKWAKDHTKLKQKSDESPKRQEQDQHKAINETEQLNKTLDILDEVL